MRYFLLSCLLVLNIALVFGQNNVLTEKTLWQLRRVSAPVVAPDGRSVLYSVRTPDVVANKQAAELYTLATDGGKPALLVGAIYAPFAAKYCPDGKRVGFLSAKSGSVQMWEVNAGGGEPMQVTNIEDGIGGFIYAPSQRQLLFIKEVQLDKRVKELYPDLPKVDAKIIDGLNYRHWDTWEDGAYSHLFLMTYKEGKVEGTPLDLMPGERYDCPNPPDSDEGQVTWSPDSRTVVYSCKKMSGTAYATSTNTDLYAYDVPTGKTANLTLGMQGYDNSPAFSPDGKYLAWLSMERAGYESDKNRIMLMDWVAKTKKEVTLRLDRSTNSFAFSLSGDKIYATVTDEGTKQIYTADLETNEMKPLTKGDHDYTEAAPAVVDGKLAIVGLKMSMSAPSELYTVDAESGMEKQLTFTNRDILAPLKMGKIEKRWVKASDGKRILTWVAYPPNFDPTKKYPTLLFCQGGPQSPVSQFFSYRWNFQLMAANGYIVVAPNRRGLQGFGQAWCDEIVGDYGGQAMTDLLSAIDEVSAEPYVNKQALAAVGASFGGYSVYWLAGNHNKRFKAFIAHCGMFNMESWYGATEEMFFATHDQNGPYWENKANYIRFSPHQFVKNWDTPILVIHNEKDFRVPLGEGLQAFNAAQIKGIESRFLYFPDENHWVTKPQNSILWQRVFFDWLKTHLAATP